MKGKGYILLYYCLVVLLSGLTMLLFSNVLENRNMPDPFWPIPLFFALMPLLMWSMEILMSKQKDVATMSILGYRGTKLILALAFLLSYMKSRPDCSFEFAMVFFSFYFVLTAVETVHIVKKVKK